MTRWACTVVVGQEVGLGSENALWSGFTCWHLCDLGLVQQNRALLLGDSGGIGCYYITFPRLRLMVSTAIETYSGNVTKAKHLKELGGWKGRHRNVGPCKVDSPAQSSPYSSPLSWATETGDLSTWIPLFLQFISAGQKLLQQAVLWLWKTCPSGNTGSLLES